MREEDLALDPRTCARCGFTHTADETCIERLREEIATLQMRRELRGTVREPVMKARRWSTGVRLPIAKPGAV